MNQKKPKKNNSSGLLWLVILLLIWIFNRVDFSMLCYRLQRMLRTADISLARIALLAILVIVILATLGLIVGKRAAGRRGDGVTPSRRRAGATEHSHDRLTGPTDSVGDAAEHWKRQLDSFLEAGLIDRAEYRALLERRRTGDSRW